MYYPSSAPDLCTLTFYEEKNIKIRFGKKYFYTWMDTLIKDWSLLSISILAGGTDESTSSSLKSSDNALHNDVITEPL